MKNNSNEKEQLRDENGNPISMNPDANNGQKENLVDKKTLKKYKVHWYQRIPYPVRALFIKYWFFGLNYFLFEMGLGSISIFRESTGDTFAAASMILILISGLALGVFNDIFVYNILDVIEDYPGQKKPFVIFKSKKVYSLFINVIFGIVVAFLGRWLSGLIALAIDPELTNVWGWFREPLTCGLMMFIVDGALISIKNFAVYLYHHFKGDTSSDFE